MMIYIPEKFTIYIIVALRHANKVVARARASMKVKAIPGKIKTAMTPENIAAKKKELLGKAKSGLKTDKNMGWTTQSRYSWNCGCDSSSAGAAAALKARMKRKKAEREEELKMRNQK